MKNNTKWSIDPAHSEIAFKVKHLMIANVRGVFRKFDAIITTTGTDFTTADINLWIDAASINTGDEKRDGHLQSADFLDVMNYKKITFTADAISKTGTDASHEMCGELSIKGITKTIKLNVMFGGIILDPWGNERAGFNVSGKINRKDWKLDWNTMLQLGGVMVSEEVNIICEIQLIKLNEKDTTVELEASEDKRGIAF